MELKRVDTALLKILYLVVTGIVLSQVLGMDTVSSALFLLTFPLTILLWGRSIREKLDSMDLLVLLVAALAIISVLLNALLTEAVITFAYIKKLIMFIMSLLFFQSANKMRAGENIIRYINAIVDVITLFLIAMYFLRGSQMYMLNGRMTLYLTFGFTNPNLTGMFLVCLYMLEAYRLFSKENIGLKILHVIMALFLVWFIWSTRSRNCLLVMVIYTVFSIWLIFRSKRKLRITKAWAALFAVFPALLMVAYMLMINSRWVMDTFSFLIGEGKDLDSRVRIWRGALGNLSQSPVFGAYYEISQISLRQMHNSHLDIAASYGLPVLVFVCVLLGKYLHQNGRIYGDKRSYIYILGFACAIIMGVGEAAVFSGGLGIYLFAGTFLLLANKAENAM